EQIKGFSSEIDANSSKIDANSSKIDNLTFNNYYNLTTSKASGYINKSGNTVSASGYLRTSVTSKYSLIEVVPTKTYTYTGIVDKGDMAGVVFLDSGFNFISYQFDNGTGSSSYTRELININNGTAYIGSSEKNDFFIEAKVTYPANSVKSVFVDAINGNDNNKGFESHPYKTINKAISEVKDCGEGVINIK